MDDNTDSGGFFYCSLYVNFHILPLIILYLFCYRIRDSAYKVKVAHDGETGTVRHGRVFHNFLEGILFRLEWPGTPKVREERNSKYLCHMHVNI